ncbi:MAG: GvpL/GvpF family gas vesicle protein [Dehalococcoidia bacterium]
MVEEQNHRQKYLYCIIESAEERSFGAEAIGGRGDVVNTVIFEDLAMVVSDSPDQKYDNTRANMMAHETVIERVMGEGFTVLPVRFGTVTREASKTPVEDIQYKVLKARAQEFHELLDEMDNKVELGLRALWRDEKAIFEEILAENGAIRKRRDSLTDRPPASTHYERWQLGERVKAAMDSKREKEGGRLLAGIRPLAVQHRENKVIMDRMVLTAAFLVDKYQEAEFDEMVRRLDGELEERMMFKYSGPNPPFNFVEIVVTWEE